MHRNRKSPLLPPSPLRVEREGKGPVKIVVVSKTKKETLSNSFHTINCLLFYFSSRRTACMNKTVQA